LQFRLLWHQVSIDTTDASSEIDEALSYLTNDATHGFAPVTTMSYKVTRLKSLLPGPTTNSYSILEEGDPLATVAEPGDVLDVIYRRSYQRCFELASLRGWVRLHAATIDLPAGRVLLSAPSGTGKTTLACALRLGGVAVPSDESVLVRDGESIPVPRRFHVKVPAPVHLPELNDIIEQSPQLRAQAVAAIDPRELGGAWSIDQRPVRAVVLLERADETRIEPLSAVAAMPMLIAECFRNQEATERLFEAATSIAQTATCHRLLVDDPRDAGALLTALLAE